MRYAGYLVLSSGIASWYLFLVIYFVMNIDKAGL